MKMPNKKILAVAVASAFAGAAQAQITLPNTSITSPIYASQITVPSGGIGLTNTSVVGGLTGWGWSSGSNVFIRYDLSGGTFTANPSAMSLGLGSTMTVNPNATATLSAGGASASNAIYQVTSANSIQSDAGANALLTLAGIKATSTAAPVTITQSIYDTAANAVAGGATGKLATSKTGTVISFASAYTVTNTAGAPAVADVANTTGIYRSFTGSNLTAPLGSILIANTANANTAAGMAADVGNVLAAGTYITVSGDFTAAANANGTFTTPAAGRVFLGNSTCGTNGVVASTANTVSATTATILFAGYTVAGVNGNSTLCLTSAGNTAIPAATYTASHVPTAATGYTVSASTPSTIGSVVRNGGQLVSAWFTLSPGWLSRFILNNNSSQAATYTVTVVSETGNTLTLNSANLSGSIPANGMIVVNASDLVSAYTGFPRAAATFTFAAQRTAVDGIGQTVNASTGSIANFVLVAPGTN